MYVVFKHSGKQYKAGIGDELKLDRLQAELKSVVEVSEVLAISDGDLKVGSPFVAGAKVVLEVLAHLKEKKVIIYKKRRRKDSKLKRGFRRQITRVKVKDIKA